MLGILILNFLHSSNVISSTTSSPSFSSGLQFSITSFALIASKSVISNFNSSAFLFNTSSKILSFNFLPPILSLYLTSNLFKQLIYWIVINFALDIFTTTIWYFINKLYNNLIKNIKFRMQSDLSNIYLTIQMAMHSRID